MKKCLVLRKCQKMQIMLKNSKKCLKAIKHFLPTLNNNHLCQNDHPTRSNFLDIFHGNLFSEHAKFKILPALSYLGGEKMLKWPSQLYAQGFQALPLLLRDVLREVRVEVRLLGEPRQELNEVLLQVDVVEGVAQGVGVVLVLLAQHVAWSENNSSSTLFTLKNESTTVQHNNLNLLLNRKMPDIKNQWSYLREKQWNRE